MQRVLVAALASLVLSASAFADVVVFERLPAANPDQNRGLQSETNLLEIADDFRLSAGAAITSVDWWGFIARAGTDETVPRDFLISFYAHAGGSPGALIASRSVTAGGVATGLFGSEEIYKYSASIAPVSLSGSTQYWISIQEDEVGGVRWLWQSAASAATDLGFGTRVPGSSWVVRDVSGFKNVSFVLSAVPEPGTGLLLAIGGATYLLIRRRRRS